MKEQIDAIFEDIYPDAVKIGMVSSTELIHVIAERLKFYKAKNIVVDPVMVATSGSALMKNDAVNSLAEELFPIATLITPNIPEAQVLSGLEIKDEEDMLAAAKKSVTNITVLFLSRAVIVSTMQMICFTLTVKQFGSRASVSITLIRTERDARFQVRLRQILQRDLVLMNL